MKKLFTLLIITLLSVSAFGQAVKPEIGMGGVADYFSQVSACEMYNAYQKDGMGNAFLESTFSFVVDGKTFLVSYDKRPDNINSSNWTASKVRTRNLYLYCLEKDGWKLAVDEPLKLDFKTREGLCEYYYPRFDIGNLKGGIIVQENGTVIINLIVIYNELSSLAVTQYKVKEIKLLPLGDDMYKKL